MTFFPEQKSRVIPSHGPIFWSSRPNGLAPWVPRSAQPMTSETIISQCHTGSWSKRRSAPRYGTEGDIGGFMTLTRKSTRYVQTFEATDNLRRGTHTFGQFFGRVDDDLDDVVLSSKSAMDVFGTSAIARVLPTNPNASLATALGELKQDGLPRLPGADMRDQVARSRAAGSEFLNIEFGWLPLVSDLRSFANSVRNARKLIEQYVRDSDRKIRRRYALPPQTFSQSFLGNGQTQSGIFSVGGGATLDAKLETRFWFSGAFRYHVPVGDSVWQKLLRYESLANHLFGTRITPEVVWELAPWSWAVDWFSNAGDVIHNISTLGTDGLVMQYGYAMRTMRKQQLWGCTVPGGASGIVEVLEETKQRVPANPYGFGIDDVSLNRTQLAILAALGLSRGQRDNTRL